MIGSKAQSRKRSKAQMCGQRSPPYMPLCVYSIVRLCFQPRMILQGLLLADANSPPLRGWLRIENARIVEIGEGNSNQNPDIGHEQGEVPVLISPGFIDAHLHLPQIDAIGYDGMELMPWLDRVIYPAEMRWSDENAAIAQISRAYSAMLRSGTLGYAAFLTSHFHGYVQTVRVGHQVPLRGIVGQSLMDRHAPRELLGQGLTRMATSERARVACSVNPRFAVACSDQMLEIARQKALAGAIIHTHLAESKHECEFVKQLFPRDSHYTGVYDRHGLLTNRTLLAHCLHLSNEEWDLIAARECVVVHCPTANTFLKSGIFDLNAPRQRAIRLAIGSDIGAGPDFSMPRVARAMIDAAKLRATFESGASIPTPAQAWNLITRGNADALGWSDAGRIEIGAAADLLVIQPPFEVDEHLMPRLLYTWRDEYITHRIVNGNLFEPLATSRA
jgi:guanine deaminase